MNNFDIIDYLSGLTAFVFDKSVLERIAYDRGVRFFDSYDLLEQKHKDLLLADLLFVAYTAPNLMASVSNSHGSFKQAVGNQQITDRDQIYSVMIQLYKKHGDEKLQLVPEASGSLNWINEDDSDVY